MITLLFCIQLFQLGDVKIEAEALLRQNPPVSLPIVVMVRNDDPILLGLIKKQISALADLNNISKKGMIPLLVSYLDYPNSKIEILSDPGDRREDLNEIKSRWPAFSAIINDPFAADELPNYILNTSYPLDGRIAAWQTLRYVNKSKFEQTFEAFDVEMNSASPAVKAYILAIKDGRVPFHGIQRPENW